MQDTQILTIVGANLVIFLSIIGLTIKLHLHHNKMLKEIHEDLKDFQGRMEKQDAEFKAHMMYEHKKG